MDNKVKILNLKQDHGNYGWSWIVEYQDYEENWGKTTRKEYHTNNAGEGLFSYDDGAERQHSGTMQFHLPNAKNKKSVYAYIRRQFMSEEDEV